MHYYPHSAETGRSSIRQKRRYSVRPFYVTFLAFIFLGIVSLVLERLGSQAHNVLDRKPWPQHAHLNARTFLGADGNFRRDAEVEVSQCRLVRNADDQCSFVRTNCPDNDDGLFSYLQLYYCTFAHAKPLAFILLVVWLSLLFSTIGIAASDFLCINLSTLASVLGMSESLTGVTFLAFGNGSPDVFSTLAAMRSNSGSLAIGELIGAASFITSVVAGSMALIRPFRVARRSFVRDVGYFVVAVCFSMLLLADGRLNAWESAAMVGLYCFYVVTVVTWHWYCVRKRRVYERDIAARTHFHIPENQELDIEEAPEDDDPDVARETRSLLRSTSTEDFHDLERSDPPPAWKEDDEDDETRNRYLAEIRDNMHVSRPVTSRRRNTFNPIRPSLIGALEFQSVLSSLMKSRNIHHQNQSTGARGYFDDPDSQPSYQFDSRSVSSDPRLTRAKPHDHLSARVRAGSADDAAGLELDSELFKPSTSRPVHVTVSRPSGELVESQQQTTQPDDPDRIGQSTLLDVPATPSSSGHPPRRTGPAAPPIQTTGLLLPPQPDVFRSPNYQSDNRAFLRSPLQVSPTGRSPSFRGSESELESPVIPFPPLPDEPSSVSSRAPSIRLPPAASPTELLQIHDRPDQVSCTITPMWWWPYWVLPPPESLLSTFFPSLSGWTTKGIWERILSIFAVPSVLLLTLTLPVIEPIPLEYSVSDPVSVVVTPAISGEDPARPVQLLEDSPVLQGRDDESAEEPQRDMDRNPGKIQQHSPRPERPRWDSEAPAAVQQPPPDPSTAPAQTREWNRWLVSTQLVLGPFFIALIGWTSMDPEMHARNLLLPFLCSLLFSLLCLTGLTLSAQRGHHPSQPQSGWRPFLALLGFVVAISWIATIATEVVNLLKTLGVILNISDSLLGLTVFAVGNSLGDLVADVTVARLGYPVMALSACFGGPMLNILLGIGIGGLYMTWKSSPTSEMMVLAGSASIPVSGGSYEIAISRVLVISGATLLTTLIGLLVVVPLNKWKMDRKIGWGLVILWSVSTVANVIIEATA